MGYLKRTILQSINGQEDFEAAFYSTFGLTAAASSSVGTNEYYYDSTTGELSVNNDGTKQTYYRFFFGSLKRGDTLEIEFESQNVSSPDGIVASVSETNTYGTTGTLVVTTYVNTTQGGPWVTSKLKYPHLAKNYDNVYLYVGMAPGMDPGTIRLRNVRARVLTSTGISPSKTEKVIKAGEIYKSLSGWSQRTDWINTDGVTFTEPDTDTLQVTYDDAFTGDRPVVTLGSEWFSASDLYIPKVSNSQTTGFQIQFFDYTGALVPLASLTNDIFIGWMAVGEKDSLEP